MLKAKISAKKIMAEMKEIIESSKHNNGNGGNSCGGWQRGCSFGGSALAISKIMASQQCLAKRKAACSGEAA